MTRFQVVLPAPLEHEVQAHLFGSGADTEEVALLFGHPTHSAHTTGVVISRWLPVPQEALLVQEADRFAMDSAYLVQHVKKARAQHESLLLAHSHPGDPHLPWFSHADTLGEANLYPLLQQRLLGRLHGALVFAPGGVSARLITPDGTIQRAAVRVVGRHVQIYQPGINGHAPASDPTHARQELMWGSHGQGLLRNMTIAVVGAGGTGSVVAQQLIHLGVGHLIVVDPQRLEDSNLARVVGARQEDVGRTNKVEIVKRTASHVDPTIEVRAIADDVCRNSVLEEILDADLLFVCTHGHYSRAVLNALAVQYRLPLVDMGFRIDLNATHDRVASAVGEVRLVVPGGYCLSCAGVLNAALIHAEKASPEERAAHPSYFADLDTPDPSVITLNSVIASLAISVGLDMFVPTMHATGAQDSYRYNALKGIITNIGKDKGDTCGICGSEGLGGLGDDHPRPGHNNT